MWLTRPENLKNALRYTGCACNYSTCTYMRTTTFANRAQAGEMLGTRVAQQTFKGAPVVLGLPRGGVPVAACVATALRAPLDIILVRKIGAPGHEELACGAIAPHGVVVWNERVLRYLGLTPGDLAETIAKEETEMRRREAAIRGPSTPALALKERSVVIVDDGIATGATMRAAIRAVKQTSPLEVIVALPVGPADTCDTLQREEGCRVICLRLIEGEAFGSVGQWYDDFSQVETEECRDVLERNREE